MAALLLSINHLSRDRPSHPADVSARLLRVLPGGLFANSRSPFVGSVIDRLRHRWREGTSGMTGSQARLP